jgi:hypothetical protein
VYYAIPREIVNLLLEKKRVIFDNLGSFTPRKMQSNLPAVEETYKVAFKPSGKTKKLMMLLRATETSRGMTKFMEKEISKIARKRKQS